MWDLTTALEIASKLPGENTGLRNFTLTNKFTKVILVEISGCNVKESCLYNKQ